MTPYERVLELLHGVRSAGNGHEARCPAHDDRKQSLCISECTDGAVLIYCQAGCSTETVLESVGLTFKDLYPSGLRHTRSSKPIVATYDYRDESGELLSQVVRQSPKGFLQRRPDGNRGWVWKLGDVRRGLYRLPQLANADPAEAVYVAEGEKDVHALERLGLIATTNPGGAGKGKWHKEYSQTLKGRDVLIIPDNDDAGSKHAERVAQSLTGVAHSVKVVTLPDLRSGGDVADWIASGGTIEALNAITDAAPLWQPANDGEPSGDDDEKDRKSNSNSVAKQMVHLAIESGAELFRDERDEPYAAVPCPEGRRILSIRSKDFGLWLRRLAWEQMEKPLTRELLATARETLASFASFDAPQHELHPRCARLEGEIWIDLDGIRAVCVSPGSWQIVDRPPILFRTFRHQKPLPVPERGGSLEQILKFVRLKGADIETLFLSYLVAGVIPDIPVTALIVSGVQGSTKSTFLKVVKSVLDPSAVMVRGGVKDKREFALAAFQNRVLFFDNLTYIPDWLSDCLCGAVTGAGDSQRTLYENEDTTFFDYQRAVGIAGINNVAIRADLLDRSLIIELEPVPAHERQDEQSFWAEFKAARPSIFGGLLDALSRAMVIEPALTIDEQPRMADFARWGEAGAQALGHRPGTFLQAYEANVRRQNDAAIDASSVAQVILLLMDGKELWIGTPSELLHTLKENAQDLNVDTKSKEWPKSPNRLTRHLREIEPNLKAMGICCERRRGKKREIILTQCGASFGQADVGVGHPPLGSFSPSSRSDFSSTAPAAGTENAKEWFEERAAIREYDSGLSREEAELQAQKDLDQHREDDRKLRHISLGDGPDDLF